MRLKGANVLLGVTGSIAAYRACDLITALRNEGASVRVVMTEDAKHFITPLTLQSMSGNEVMTDFFSLPGRAKPVHIELARWAGVICVAPATADAIARFSYGLAGDLLSCTVLATEAKLLVAPAMNEKMYFHPATQENIERLKKRGVKIIDPIKGHLVCVEEGIGHLAEQATIVSAVIDACTKK
jgi:phosphopantothenoylcysteine decarboxylase/phosphopantothenate--cysteine ligase